MLASARHRTHARLLTAATLVAVSIAGCSTDTSTDAPTSPPRTGPGAKTASQARAVDARHTSCSSVLYVGESTSIGLVTPMQIPDAGERLQARMREVGVTKLSINISGGRSSMERLLGRPNTLDVITPEVAKRFTGCYVLALGVNDAANSSMPGTALTAKQRVERVMSRIGTKRPVLWTLNSTDPTLSGPYRNANMTAFTAELKAATARYPNLRLYDWPAEVDPAWREGDGIHDRRIGSRHRAVMVSNALAVAFPAGGPANPATTVGSVRGKPASTANRPKLSAAQGDQGVFWAADKKALVLYTDGPKP